MAFSHFCIFGVTDSEWCTAQ